jgi:hypothetical protein
MRKSLLAVAILACGALPSAAAAQAFGIGGRIGTLGVGGELAVELVERVVVRGGVGLTPLEPTATLDDIEVTLSLPDWYNVGMDFYLNGAIRLGGGLLFKSDEPSLSGEFTTSQDIGGQTFTPQEIGTLTGVFDSRDQVPYVLIGFGKHTAPGFGLFLDLGVAFLGEPDIRLGAEGGTLDPDTNAQFRAALDAEAADFEAEVGTYLKLWPILSVGLRIGLG